MYMSKKFHNFFKISSSQDEIEQNLSKIREIDPILHFELDLNKTRIGNFRNLGRIAEILKSNPQTQFRLDCPFVSEAEVADHLNGGLGGRCNSPMFSLNSIYQKTQYVDVALVQCFFGQDALQENAIELALKFMSMSNPRPREWVFVEAQRREMDAKFKWVVGLGCKYVFVKV